MRDECFIRGKVPMTKSEIRAVVLSKLQLDHDSIMYDVGAGTGSVSIEAAIYVKAGHVYAFEQKPEACDLITANAGHFGLHNLTLIPGKAPDTIDGLPKADRAFIGGSSGNMKQILDTLFGINPQMRVVVTAIALETLQQIMDYLKVNDKESEIVSLQVTYAEQVGSLHMMKAQNPIYVITIQEKTA